MDSATGLTGSGSRDWVVQRLSAIVLAVWLDSQSFTQSYARLRGLVRFYDDVTHEAF
jgi:succinate dehydrogenase hydrophobic anchor subunit